MGSGPLRTAQPGFTPSDARYLLYLLAQVRDPGKIDREVGRLPGVASCTRRGGSNAARHDNGIVLWPGGALVVTVMTYRPSGAGVSSDVLAGRVAASRCGGFAADVRSGARLSRARRRFAPVHEMNARVAGVLQARGRALGVRNRKRGPAPGGDSAGYRAPITETSAHGHGLYAFRKHSRAGAAGVPRRWNTGTLFVVTTTMTVNTKTSPRSVNTP